MTAAPVIKLASEADVIRALAGTFTLADLYDIVRSSADTTRDRGHDPVPGHTGDWNWTRRVRGTLATMQRTGRASRIDRTTWVIQGTRQDPVRLLLVIAGATPRQFELRLQTATELLADLDGPVDLVFCDPPWGLGRGEGHFTDGNGYRRDHTRVIDGYVDVDPSEYSDFTHGWIAAAAAALRRGGQLAVVTGPQRAAIVQVAAEATGFTWVNSVKVQHPFPLYTKRRFAQAHWVITVMTRGPLDSKHRVFNPPAEQVARSGALYPLDWWTGVGRADRPGQLRNDNELPLKLALRGVRSWSNQGEHVVDPFLGGGSIAKACFITDREFTGGDDNPKAVKLTAARLLVECGWPADKQPALFPVG